MGVCGDIILGGRIGGISVGYIGGKGGVKRVFITNFTFLIFLVFHGDGVGGEFAIYQ